MMRAWLVGVVALATSLAACGKDGEPPGGFGVNVTVSSRLVPNATLMRATTGRLTAAGLTPAPTSQAVDVAVALQSGEARFRFIPKVTSGTLTLTLDVLDAAGAVLASGTSSAVTLIADRAVAASIVLVVAGVVDRDGGVDAPSVPGPRALGEPCTIAAECGSLQCADGVCCNAACSGTCESCALEGKRGSCEPVPDGVDPESECVAVVPTAPVDAGADDGGSDVDGGLQLNAPDGGIARMAVACGGSCNGARACRFPGADKSCGTQWCNTDGEVAAMVCNGRGSCEPALRACIDYTCDNGACRSQCSALDHCQQDVGYCSADNSCKPKKGDGIACSSGSECTSGFCAAGICCNSACDAPFTCAETPGKCKCPGVVCPAGVACQLYYRDADGDGYGDKFGKVVDATAVPGCAGATAPPGYVNDSRDCDDADGNAHPGQTGFFETASKGRGTYDYDCDGKLVEQFPDALGSTCRFYAGKSSCDDGALTCQSANEAAGVGCHLECLRAVAAVSVINPGPVIVLPRCYPTANDGFVTDVACGAMASFRVCGSCSTAGGNSSSKAYNYNRRQPCH